MLYSPNKCLNVDLTDFKNWSNRFMSRIKFKKMRLWITNGVYNAYSTYTKTCDMEHEKFYSDLTSFFSDFTVGSGR